MRLLAVLGGGGHTTEMVHLIQLLGPEYEYGYVLLEEDVWSESRLPFPGPVFRTLRPGGQKAHNLLRDIRMTLMGTWQMLRIVRRFCPKAVVTTGAGIAITATLACKLSGVKVIFVETGSRVTALSATGKILYRLADLFLVQWEPLAEKHARAIYAGRL
jgi:UDP-N-acetylglucosamine:LPS N-acetylglucosamine transferase